MPGLSFSAAPTIKSNSNKNNEKKKTKTEKEVDSLLVIIIIIFKEEHMHTLSFQKNDYSLSASTVPKKKKTR